MPDSIAAIILAAGSSSRFGQTKQLAKFQGRTFISRIAQAATEAGCDPIVVVIGRDETGAIANELADFGVAICQNPDWERGIGSSIRRGIEASRSGPSMPSAAILLTCDQPFVTSNVIAQLVSAYGRTGKSIIASEYEGTRGIPALFACEIFDELRALPDEHGAKPIINADPARVVVCAFPRGAIDIDTPADYAALIAGKENTNP